MGDRLAKPVDSRYAKASHLKLVLNLPLRLVSILVFGNWLTRRTGFEIRLNYRILNATSAPTPQNFTPTLSNRILYYHLQEIQHG